MKDKEKDWLSIDSTDDNKNLQAFTDFWDNHSEREKNNAANNILDNGEMFLQEIDNKKSLKDISKGKMIDYILKHSNKYPKQTLWEYDYNDVWDIHNEIKWEKTPKIKKFFKELINQFRPNPPVPSDLNH